jgi:peptidoglycan LD-endopeptidase CwlK
MTIELTKRSKDRMLNLHPLLCSLILESLQSLPYEIQISETVRSKERQEFLFNTGKSKALKSKHLADSKGFSHAFDFYVLIGGELTWRMEFYKECSDVFKSVAEKLKINIVWGGDWISFKDGPHIQLEI